MSKQPQKQTSLLGNLGKLVDLHKKQSQQQAQSIEKAIKKAGLSNMTVLGTGEGKK